MAVPDKDQVCLALAEKNPVVGGALSRLKANAVISSWTGVSTEHSGPVRQLGAELNGQLR
jgi:hypothetical protein